MTNLELLSKTKVQKIGKVPVVVLPLKIWREIEDYLEDAQMMHSNTFKAKIAKARREKKLYSYSEIKKLLNL
jgi:hypothetical protein